MLTYLRSVVVSLEMIAASLRDLAETNRKGQLLSLAGACFSCPTCSTPQTPVWVFGPKFGCPVCKKNVLETIRQKVGL